MAADSAQIEFAVDTTLVPGVELDIEGLLWGGNLAMVCSLLGTAFMPHVAGGILVLEDVNEPAYRIERLLLQLWHAGVLQRQRAVVLGDFSGMASLPNDAGYGLPQAIAAIRQRCHIPFVGGLPLGHAARRATLAVGAVARLSCSATESGEHIARLSFAGYPRVPASGVRL
jgi:muramoyltetrapeptide carboxypeptidase